MVADAMGPLEYGRIVIEGRYVSAAVTTAVRRYAQDIHTGLGSASTASCAREVRVGRHLNGMTTTVIRARSEHPLAVQQNIR